MLVGDSANREASKVPKGLCFRCEENMQQNPFGGAPVSKFLRLLYPLGSWC